MAWPRIVVGLALLGACENRVSSTEQCLGSGGTTATFRRYTFDVDHGPALDVAGNCRVVLEDCVVRAREGFRVRERGVVEMRGGRLETTRWAVEARDDAQVRFERARVVGGVRALDRAVVTGVTLPTPGAATGP